MMRARHADQNVHATRDDAMDMTVGELGNGALCLALNGRLDTVGVDRVEKSFNAALAAQDRDVAVDLGAVGFLASMGVRMIIASARAQRARGRRLVLFAPQPLVKQTLEMVALDQIIPVLPDRAAAEASLAS